LSRGYRRKKGLDPVVTDGQTLLLSHEESGDEPFLMASVLKGIPVIVGKDRYKNGELTLKQFHVRGLLLDDGFQHLPLYRDLNIVLIDSQIGFGDGYLLPRGILREPLSYLKRADIFLLTRAEDPQSSQPLKATLHKMNPTAPIFYSYYEPSGLISSDGKTQSSHLFKGKRVFALSGIANPAYFTSLLKRCGMEVVKERVYPDHHRYTHQDLTSILGEVRNKVLIVTTEKDLVKLKNFLVDSIPLYALRIETKIQEEEEFYKRVMEIFKL
jgi:tetraacyldisaccharide 4'-kinase